VRAVGSSCATWKTADESDIGNPVKGFPPFRYLYEVNKAVESNDVVVVVKSRQMFFTWYVSAYFVWCLLFRPYSRNVFISQRERQVEDVIQSRMRFILENLDPAYPWPEFADRTSIKRLSIEHPDGEVRSLIIGTPAGPDQVRGMTATTVWLDEFGFQEYQELSLKTIRPLIKGGQTKLIITSTPNPDTHYQRICQSMEDGSVDEIMSGMWSHRNEYGDLVLSCRYDAHPDQRSEEWAERKRKEVGDLAWRVEYALEWVLPKGKPVFSEFDYEVHCLGYQRAGGFVKDEPLCVGFDFGGHHPSAVLFQRDALGRCLLHKAMLGEGS